MYAQDMHMRTPYEECVARLQKDQEQKNLLVLAENIGPGFKLVGRKSGSV